MFYIVDPDFYPKVQKIESLWFSEKLYWQSYIFQSNINHDTK